MYIWQHKSCPSFYADSTQLSPRLEVVLALQQRLLSKASDLSAGLDKDAELDALIQSAIITSEIEGDCLDAESVRSSVARQLWLEQAGLPDPTRPDPA
jgi:Fic family protein